MKPFLALVSGLCAFTGAAAPVADAPAPAAEVFRIGVSYGSFGTVSRNDATAALKAWVESVSRERKLKLRVQVEVLDDEDRMREVLAREQVDAVSMTAEEYAHSGQKPEAVFVTAKDNSFAEQYVLLAHRRGGLDDLAGLKGRKLVRHLSPKMSPALPWLETALASRGLAQTGTLLEEVTTQDSPSKAVLRVFFRQSDACLVTTSAFALACELNPQLRKDLKVLATSPPLVPSVFFFRPGYAASVRSELEAAILAVHTTSAGQQVLTVFQGTRMEKQPVACLDTTLRMLAEYERVKSTTQTNLARPITQAANLLTP